MRGVLPELAYFAVLVLVAWAFLQYAGAVYGPRPTGAYPALGGANVTYVYACALGNGTVAVTYWPHLVPPDCLGLMSLGDAANLTGVFPRPFRYGPYIADGNKLRWVSVCPGVPRGPPTTLGPVPARRCAQ